MEPAGGDGLDAESLGTLNALVERVAPDGFPLRSAVAAFALVCSLSDMAGNERIILRSSLIEKF